jgi:hypothetical protein
MLVAWSVFRAILMGIFTDPEMHSRRLVDGDPSREAELPFWEEGAVVITVEPDGRWGTLWAGELPPWGTEVK